MTAIVLTSSVIVLLACFHVQCRIAATVRRRLRPQAERIVIEKRWIERAARSKHAFELKWRCELRELYHAHVSRLARRVFGLQSFEWALDAELACLTNPEIESWTFIDRMSDSRAAFERIVAQCLAREGWRVARLHGADRLDLHLVVSDGERRIGIHCHHGASSPECLAVHDAAIGRSRQRCDAVCLVSNGRFSGAVTVFAATQDVALLHCSQLDQIAGLVPGAALRCDRDAGPARMAA